MLAQLLSRRARLEDSVAVVDLQHGRYTYSELEALSVRLASALKGRVGVGGRVVCIMPNCAHYVALFFALRKLGATIVPLNPRAEEQTLRAVLDEVKPSLVVDEYRGLGVRLSELSAQEKQVDAVDPKANPAAMILYTGGTTGRPKGAVITEDNVLWNALNTVVSWGLSNRDVTYNTMPMYHTGGWNVLTIPLLLAGGRVVLDHEGFDPGRVIEVLEREGCTIYMGVPTMLEEISAHPSFEKADLSRVLFVCGGGMIPRRVFERYRRRGLRLFQGYGLTEAGPNNFYIAPERFEKKPWSVGKPMLFVEARLGEGGELLLRGPHVFAGYFGRAESPVDAEGYLHTGDVFRIDEEGDYVFLDRLKDMIKSGGENVYPAEVEAALLEEPNIREAAVVGVPDEHWGEKVVAFVVVKGAFDPEKTRLSLKAKLAPYKVPKEFIVVDSLPRSPQGKLLKRVLREKYMAGGFVGEHS